ncbi:MAG: single-stranded DNA-binding protein [Alphaproteobacteria bacterium]|nr:single-stranded DNA-binding protein [Alphaproteobacteria bacterium]
MLTMNRATLVGHAGRNPEMRTLPSGDEVALFSLATTERFKRRDGSDGETTEWHAIVAFGAAAEAVRKLVRKGDPVLVEGRIGTRTWTDRKGAEHRTSEIVVSGPRGQVNVLAKRRLEPDGGDGPPGGAAPAGAAKAVDADRNDRSADAVVAAASDRTADTGTEEDAGTGGDADAGSGSEGNGAAGTGGANTVQKGEDDGAADEDAAPAEAASVGAEGDAAAAADATGRVEPSEANCAAGGTSGSASSKGGDDDAGTGEAESADAGDAVTAGADGRPGDADHD